MGYLSEKTEKDDVTFQTDCLHLRLISSPQTAGEGSARVEVEELGGVALEGVTIRHGSPHGVLEFLVAAGNAGAPLQLVGPQRRRQQVGQIVVPHGCHLQVLEDSDIVQGVGPKAVENLAFKIFPRFSLAVCSGIVLPSCVQTPGSASPAPADC